MSNEHFCLKWNNFQNNIIAALGNLKLDEDFVDVTLSCEGKSIKAHRVILSACSDYFRDVFRDNPCNHPVVIIRDSAFVDVDGLIRYVYRGEVDVLPERLQSFLRTAELLKIKGLADQSLSKNIDQEDGNTIERETPPSIPMPHVPCPVSPLNVPILGFRANQLHQQNHLQPINPSPPPTLPQVESPTPPQAQTPISNQPKIISSPIRVPIPPTPLHLGLKHSHFSNLAQYLSGSSASPPSPVTDQNTENGGLLKRRKTTPKKKLETSGFFIGQGPHHYSGSTSSLTASPTSPPHSHSTEGEGPLEICEESDRDSARSSESTDCPLKSLSFGLVEKTSVESRRLLHHHQNPYQDTDEPPLVIEDTEMKSEDSISYGETLDLSRRGSSGEGKSCGDSITSEEALNPHAAAAAQFGSVHLPVLPLHINTKGSLSSSESLTSRGSISSVSSSSQVAPTSKSDEDLNNENSDQGLVIDCSIQASNPGGIRRPKAVKAKKSSNKYQRHLAEEMMAENQAFNMANPNNQDDDDGNQNNSQHPRNRWRCMQPRLCAYCFKTFSNSFNLKQHIVNVHVESPGVKCSLCEKVVKNKWYLRKHLVTAHGAPLKRVNPEALGKNRNGSSKKPLDMSLSTSFAMADAKSLDRDPGSPLSQDLG